MAVVVGGLLAVSTSASGAAAQTSPKPCYERTTKQPFIRWNDYAHYFRAPSGHFEYGLGTWQATGSAWTVSENEPWRVDGGNDASSLELGPGSWSWSREFCVYSDEESLRFFYRSPGVAGAGLMVRVRAKNFGAESVNTLVIDGSRWGWALSPQVSIPRLLDANGQQNIIIEIGPVNVGAWWRIDDVMVDPWRFK